MRGLWYLVLAASRPACPRTQPYHSVLLLTSTARFWSLRSSALSVSCTLPDFGGPAPSPPVRSRYSQGRFHAATWSKRRLHVLHSFSAYQHEPQLASKPVVVIIVQPPRSRFQSLQKLSRCSLRHRQLDPPDFRLQGLTVERATCPSSLRATTMPSMPFAMSSLFPPNYSLKASGSRPPQSQATRRRPEVHPLQRRVEDPEPSFTDLLMALPLPPSVPNSNAASPTSALFENPAAMKSAPSLPMSSSRSRTPSNGGISRRPSEVEFGQSLDVVTPPSLSKAQSSSDLRATAASQRTPSLTPRPRTRSTLQPTRPTTPPRRDTATFQSCMES